MSKRRRLGRKDYQPHGPWCQNYPMCHCTPECGRHPQGCSWGGFSDGYWLVTDGCGLAHPDLEAQPTVVPA